MRGSLRILLILLPFMLGRNSLSADGFSKVHCGTDIRAALIGQTMKNEPVAATESRHKDLGLQDLGGTEISDDSFLISWRICGEEYVLLEQKDVVRDALKFPPHSKESPQFIGACQSNHDTVLMIAILENAEDDFLPAKVAWRIDEKLGKFVVANTEGVRCPRDGITTTDLEQEEEE
jgi:hypothetical protein